MEVVKKAASGAVDSIRNSPLFRRKFGTRSPQSESPAEVRRHTGAISPEKDTTPFVQGVYFHVDYLGKKSVDSEEAQDHGCTDEAVSLLWNTSPESPLAKQVSIKISTTNLRVKEVSKSPLRVNDGDVVSEGLDVQETGILYEFPLFRISYCGTNPTIPEAFSFVAKDTDGKFYSYVFRCANKDKSYALALAVAKAFYLAYQILLEQQGNFPPGPERELLFEPQRPDDTTQHPDRPTIQPERPQESILDATDDGSSPLSVAPPTSVPCLRVSRPSVTSIDSENLTLACADEDFARLAKARSNPDILRSNLDEDDIKGGHHSWTETLRLHADAGSRVQTPMGSTEELNELIHSSTSS